MDDCIDASLLSLKGKPETGTYDVVMIHSQVPGLGPQVSGSGVQHQVQVQDPHPYPNLKTRTWIPISRDLRPEDAATRSRGNRRPECLPLPTANRLPLTARGLAAQGRDASAYASVLNPRSRHRRAPTSSRHPLPEAATRHPKRCISMTLASQPFTVPACVL